MLHTVYVKTGAVGSIQAVKYEEVSRELDRHPSGFVGVEMSVGGTMRHYLYQKIENAVRRYPLRKIGAAYSCMKGYACLLYDTEDKANYFGTPQEASSPPSLPAGSSFFNPSDERAVQAIMDSERIEKQKPLETAPFFKDLPLTKEQQEFLYRGPVLKEVTFQGALAGVLNDKKLSPVEKENILKACISQEHIELSDDAAEEQAKVIRTCFLMASSLKSYPGAILSSKALTQGTEKPPTLGEMHAYYVCCIQTHLAGAISANFLDPLTASISLGAISTTEPVTLESGLTKKDEICLDALNALLMMSQQSVNLERLMANNTNFMTVFDEVYEMVCDLKKTMDDKSRQTTFQAKYELIYREFFVMHTIDLDGFRQSSPCVARAHEALQSLALSRMVTQFIKASLEKRGEIACQLRELQKAAHPNIRQRATRMLALHQKLPADRLLTEDEKLTLFLECVVKGEYDVVDCMLQQNSELLLKSGKVTDYSGRAFEATTAIQYAFWAYDVDMVKILLSHVPRDGRRTQFRALINAQVDALDQIGITYQLGGERSTESRYPYSQLTETYKNVLVALSKVPQGTAFFYKSFEESDALLRLVSVAQCNVPVHVVHHFCHRNDLFGPKVDESLFRVRTMAFYRETSKNQDQMEYWYPLSPTSDGALLGKEFLIVRGDGRFPNSSMNDAADCAAPFELKYDSSEITTLFAANTQRLALLKAKLCGPQEDHDLAAGRRGFQRS